MWKLSRENFPNKEKNILNKKYKENPTLLGIIKLASFLSLFSNLNKFTTIHIHKKHG